MFDKRLLWTGIAIAATSLISIFLINISPVDKTMPMNEVVSDVRREESSGISGKSETQEYTYMLKEYQGRIAVFVPGKEDPEIIFDKLVKFLPDYDRMQMKNGIPVKDFAALNAIIEDYIS